MSDAYNAGRAAGIREALQAIAELPTGRNEDVMEGQEQSYRAVEALLDAPAPAGVAVQKAAQELVEEVGFFLRAFDVGKPVRADRMREAMEVVLSALSGDRT
jgi:hypothetical protein